MLRGSLERVVSLSATPPPTPLELERAPQRAEVLPEATWPLMEQLFAQVFGHPIDRALTAWKYGPGRGLCIAVVDHSQPDVPRAIAHCGLMFRDLLLQGRPVRGAQITDLMVAPDQRGRLLRGGSPFARAVTFALGELGGPANPGNPARFVYGFPSERAMRLGEHLGLFREIDQTHEVAWAARPGVLPEALEGSGQRWSRTIDRLWQRMGVDLCQALVGVRDGAWFLARYLRHPTRRYQVHLVRSPWLRDPVGVFAVREEGGRLELSDWVAPLAHTADVIAAARAIAWRQGRVPLATWMTRRFVPLLAPQAQSVQALQFRILCRGDTHQADLDRWRDRWWLTPGDTDYR